MAFLNFSSSCGVLQVKVPVDTVKDHAHAVMTQLGLDSIELGNVTAQDGI